MKFNTEKICTDINQYCYDARLTQKQFCKYTGITECTLIAWRKGTKIPRELSVSKVANAIGRKVEDYVIPDDEPDVGQLDYTKLYHTVYGAVLRAISKAMEGMDETDMRNRPRKTWGNRNSSQPYKRVSIH
jgi:transcriptional regulator with XRE-family HTH domain